MTLPTSRRRGKGPTVLTCSENAGQGLLACGLFSAAQMRPICWSCSFSNRNINKLLHFVKHRKHSLPARGRQCCESADLISRKSAQPARYHLYSKHLSIRGRFLTSETPTVHTEKPITRLYTSVSHESDQALLTRFLSLLFLSPQQIFSPNSTRYFLK